MGYFSFHGMQEWIWTYMGSSLKVYSLCRSCQPCQLLHCAQQRLISLGWPAPWSMSACCFPPSHGMLRTSTSTASTTSTLGHPRPGMGFQPVQQKHLKKLLRRKFTGNFCPTPEYIWSPQCALPSFDTKKARSNKLSASMVTCIM